MQTQNDSENISVKSRIFVVMPLALKCFKNLVILKIFWEPNVLKKNYLAKC